MIKIGKKNLKNLNNKNKRRINMSTTLKNKKRELFNIQTIVAVGIGSALYVVLGRFLSIPVGFVPNTYISTAIAFLAFIAVLYGPIAGALVGLIGHALVDVLLYASVWWSWVLVSAIVGLLIGLAAFKFDLGNGTIGTKQIIYFNVAQAVANLIGWGLIAPTLDILIYGEPENKVYVQGLTAALTNIVSIGLVATILLIAYAKTQTKESSLSKED